MRVPLVGLVLFLSATHAAAGPFLVPVSSPDGAFPLPDARTVAVSPEGTHVYAGGGDTLLAFARVPATGGITFLDAYIDGLSGIDGVACIAAIAISADGQHVYVAGHDEDAIAIFTRTPATGALALSDVVRDGVGGVDGVAGVDALLLSANGAHLYAAGDEDNSVTLFTRDGGTGLLTFDELHRHGVAGVTHMNGNASLALAPDGADLYVGSVIDDDAFAVQFRRDLGTGRLTFVPNPQGVGGFPPEGAPALLPDGTLLYLGGAPFARDLITGALSQTPILGVTPISRPRERVVDAAGTAIYQSNSWNDTLDGVWHDPYSGSVGRLESLLIGEEGLSLAPDGAHVYAVGRDTVSAVRIACVPIVVKARMVFSHLGDVPGDDVLNLRGEGIGRPGAFATLNPVASGMRIVMDQGSFPFLDATLPAVAFGGKGTAGWRQNDTGTSWVYVDATGGPYVAGVVRLKIQDRSTLRAGQVKITLKGRDTTYPLQGFTSVPPRVRLEFGSDACFATAFQIISFLDYDCAYKSGLKLACRLPFRP